MAYGTINTDKLVGSSGGTLSPDSGVFRNRIINGAMVIDQRNAGASVTPVNTQYLVDRFQAILTAASKFTVQQNAGSVTPPSGFTNYLGVTSSSAYSIGAGDIFGIGQNIEGYNMADFDFGKSTAKTITFSFWVRSSLTGTFGGSLNSSGDARSYPFSYTISAANTWEQKTVTIAGDTTGTWPITNGTGMRVFFSIGTGSTYSGTAGSWATAAYYAPTGATSVVGTNGATFYITGVQLEKGSTATSFDYRPYGTELQLCQRYYEKSFNTDTAPTNGLVSYLKFTSSAITTTGAYGNSPPFAVEKRTNATITCYRTDNGGTNSQPAYFRSGTWNNANSFSGNGGTRSFNYNFLGTFTTMEALFTDFQWTASAEL